MRRIASEEKRLLEDLRHGVVLGTKQFVEIIKKNIPPKSRSCPYPNRDKLPRPLIREIICAGRNKTILKPRFQGSEVACYQIRDSKYGLFSRLAFHTGHFYLVFYSKIANNILVYTAGNYFCVCWNRDKCQTPRA